MMAWSRSNIPRLLLLVVIFLAIAGYIFWAGVYGWMSIVAAVAWWLIALFGPYLRRWFSIDTPDDDVAPPRERQRRARFLTRLRWSGVAYGIVFMVIGLAQFGILRQFALAADIGLVILLFVSGWFLATA